MIAYISILVLLLLHSGILYSQERSGSFRLVAENDFFSFPGGATDRYYTNGVQLDYFYQKKRRKFPSSLLLRISDDKNIYGWGLAQYMFTPSEIDVPEVQSEDRPYAGSLFAIHSLSSYDYNIRMKVTSEIFAGVIGSWSLADKTQKKVHRITNSEDPQGWGHQIPNDILLNYNLSIEKEVAYFPGKLHLSGMAETFTGTLYTAMGAGFVLKIGKINNAYVHDLRQDHQTEKELYIILRPSARAVYYNALLQGGVINNNRNNKKGYTLNKDQIERITVFTEVGVALSLSKLEVKVLQKMRSAQFTGGHAVEFGSIQLTFKL